MFKNILHRAKPNRPAGSEGEFSVGRGERKTRGNTTIAISNSGRTASIDIESSAEDDDSPADPVDPELLKRYSILDLAAYKPATDALLKFESELLAHDLGVAADRIWPIKILKTLRAKARYNSRQRRIRQIPPEHRHMYIGMENLNFTILPSGEADLFSGLRGVMTDRQIREAAEEMVKLAR